MGIRFNADEVFEMAIRAEQNGAAFYRKAAELNADSDSKDYLNGLASMEDEHEKIFVKMREDLSGREKESTAFDPDSEGALYLATMVDQHRLEGAPSVADNLTGKESLEEILRIAIDLEKEAILFYLGLAEMVGQKQGKSKVMDIISEEKGHVAGLSQKLGSLQ